MSVASAEAAWPADVPLQHAGRLYVIRTLPISQAQPLFYSWTAREGWNPGLTDPELFSSLDPHGFHVLYAQPGLAPVCLLSTLLIEEKRGFLGPYITAPSHRGNGLGSALFAWGMQRLNPAQRSIGLDSTVEQQESYRRRGFEHITAIEHRHSGIVQQRSCPALGSAASCVILPALHPSVEAWEIAALCASCSASPLSTPALVISLLRLPGAHSFVAVDEQGALTGLIVARRAAQGYRVAPVFAQSEHITRSLLVTLQTTIGTADPVACCLHIDVPASHKAAFALMAELSLQPIFQSVRMNTAPPPAIRKDWVWGSEPCP